MENLESHSKKINIILGISFTILYFLFFPKTLGIEDEVGFFNLAFIWSEGFLKISESFFINENLQDFVKVNNWYAPIRNPGRSLAVLPFFLFGIGKLSFIGSLAIHLLLFLLGQKVLKILGLKTYWAFLFLLHPTLSLYSRTVMGDSFAGLFLLLSYYYYLKDRSFLSGFSLGFACIIRAHSALLLPSLFFMWAYRHRNHMSHLIKFLIPIALCGFSLIGYNYHIYENPLVSPGKMGTFSLGFFPTNFPFYLISLNVIFPFMLVLPLFEKEKRREFLALVIPFLIFFSCYYFFDKRVRFFETLVIGPRLFQVALPLLIAFYIHAFSKIFKNINVKIFSAMAILAMVFGLIGNIAIFWKHQNYLNQFVSVQKEIENKVPKGSTIVGNSTFRKLFAVPVFNPNKYSMSPFNFMNELIKGDVRLEGKREWYLGLLKKNFTDDFEVLTNEYRKHHKLEKIPTKNSKLELYKVTRFIP